MKKEQKIIKKIIYIALVIILSSILVFVISRPRIIASEMREYKNDSRDKHPSGSLEKKVYYRVAGGSEIKYSNYYNASSNVDCIVKENDDRCLAESQLEILSTQDDQDLLSRAVQKEYGADFKAGRVYIKYEDINSDGVDDLLVYQAQNPKNGTFYQNIFFYSAHDNHVLWQIADQYDDFYQPLLDVRTVESATRSPMVVIYNRASSPSYKFYQSINGKYSLIEPDSTDWSNYWKIIPTTTLISKVLGVWGLAAMTVILFYVLMFLIVTVLIVAIVLTAKRRRTIR